MRTRSPTQTNCGNAVLPRSSATAPVTRSRTVWRRAVSATSRFGDGTFRRWWSQMYYVKKMCAFEILWRLDYKRCLLHKCVCCHPDGQCSFPSVRILEELIVRPWSCVEGNMACDVYFCWHESFVNLNKRFAWTASIAWSFTLVSFWLHFTANLKMYRTLLPSVAYRCTNMQQRHFQIHGMDHESQ